MHVVCVSWQVRRTATQMSLWATFLIAFLVLAVAVLAGMRGYSRGRADGWRDGWHDGVASVPRPNSPWSSAYSGTGRFSYPVFAMSYLIDEDGNVLTAADRYLSEPDETVSR